MLCSGAESVRIATSSDTRYCHCVAEQLPEPLKRRHIGFVIDPQREALNGRKGHNYTSYKSILKLN